MAHMCTQKLNINICPYDFLKTLLKKTNMKFMLIKVFIILSVWCGKISIDGTVNVCLLHVCDIIRVIEVHIIIPYVNLDTHILVKRVDFNESVPITI